MDRGSLRGGGGAAHVVFGHEPRQLHRRDRSAAPASTPLLPLSLPSICTFGIINPLTGKVQCEGTCDEHEEGNYFIQVAPRQQAQKSNVFQRTLHNL